MLLAQPQHRIDHPPAHQPEVAGVARQLHAAEVLHQPVEQVRGRPLRPGLAFARTPFAVDHVESAPPAGHQRRDHLRWVLQVGIDHDHGIAAGVLQPGGGGDLLAKIARQVDDRHVRLGAVKRLQQAQRRVAAAVIDVDRFPGAQQVHHRRQPSMELRQDLGFVEYRDHHGEGRCSAHGQDVEHVCGPVSVTSRCSRAVNATPETANTKPQ
jgi:hypothetical protein